MYNKLTRTSEQNYLKIVNNLIQTYLLISGSDQNIAPVQITVLELERLLSHCQAERHLKPKNWSASSIMDVQRKSQLFISVFICT
jgi:hypothetical protein